MIYLAKYYPGTGWYISAIENLDGDFEKHEECSNFDIVNEQFELIYE